MTNAVTHSAPRSLLSVPAASSKFLASARRQQTDALMLDLEDGVAPDQSAKASARALLRDFLESPAPSAPVFVRVNDLESKEGLRDLDAAAMHASQIRALIVPKALPQTTAVAAGTGLPIVGLIETAAGIEAAGEIARHPAVIGVLFGSVDYVADVARQGGWYFSDVSWAQARVVNAAAAVNKWALAGPHTQLEDAEGLQRAIERDRLKGFAGKLCVHPNQLAPVNDGFDPSPDARAWARRVLAATQGQDTGAVRVDGQMVDRPMLEQAQRLTRAGSEEES